LPSKNVRLRPSSNELPPLDPFTRRSVGVHLQFSDLIYCGRSALHHASFLLRMRKGFFVPLQRPSNRHPGQSGEAPAAVPPESLGNKNMSTSAYPFLALERISIGFSPSTWCFDRCNPRVETAFSLQDFFYGDVHSLSPSFRLRSA